MTKPTNDPATNASKARVAFLLLLAIGITILFLGVIQGFLMALIVAAILAAVAGRTCDGLTRSCGGRRGLAATLTVFLALLIVIIPALLLLGILLDQAVQIAESVEGWVETQLQEPGELRQAIEESPTLRKLVPYQDEIVQKAAQFAAKAASFLAQSVIGGAMGAAEFFLMLFVTLYALFSFLLHGGALLDWTFRSVPLTSDDKARLVTTFTSVARATLKGTIVIGIIQGGLAGAAFAVAGIDGAVFWGVIMAVLSIIPGIGSALVWVPAVIYLAMIDRVGAAVGLGLWCALVVGTIDNFLRPMLVGKDTKMPDLLVLLTTLGGLVMFGAVGMVIGPVVGALFLAVWELWNSALQEGKAETA